ncbi:hypothetical protein BG011_009533 [Mortierella polycephala]|uniref:Uncharacterized protein n=1 Tax=Mortierella polycephala TaxID=41804 RepID=A0A9P6QAE5_9FUNG|nr:hypothetical protein BG011_009533 [Mortierella polycephala]
MASPELLRPHGSLGGQQLEQLEIALNESTRHSLPNQKTIMLHRFFPSKKKPASSPAPSYTSAILAPSTPTSPCATLVPTPSICDVSLPAELIASSKPSNPSKLPLTSQSQTQGSFARLKRSLPRKINGGRVGAEPGSTSTLTSAKDHTLLSDVSCDEQHVNVSVPRKPSKLKRWQTQSATKLKKWLRKQPAHNDQEQDEDKQELYTVAHSPLQTQEALTSDVRPHTPAALSEEPLSPVQSLVTETSFEALVPFTPATVVAPLRLHRRRTSDYACYSYSSQFQSLQDYRANQGLGRGRVNGPRWIPPRSSSLPRSFGPLSLSSKDLHSELASTPQLPPQSSDLIAPALILGGITEDIDELKAIDEAFASFDASPSDASFVTDYPALFQISTTDMHRRSKLTMRGNQRHRRAARHSPLIRVTTEKPSRSRYRLQKSPTSLKKSTAFLEKLFFAPLAPVVSVEPLRPRVSDRKSSVAATHIDSDNNDEQDSYDSDMSNLDYSENADDQDVALSPLTTSALTPQSSFDPGCESSSKPIQDILCSPSIDVWISVASAIGFPPSTDPTLLMTSPALIPLKMPIVSCNNNDEAAPSATQPRAYEGQTVCKRAGCTFPINVDKVRGIRHPFCSIPCAIACGELPRVQPVLVQAVHQMQPPPRYVPEKPNAMVTKATESNVYSTCAEKSLQTQVATMNKDTCTNNNASTVYITPPVTDSSTIGSDSGSDE